MSPRVCIITGGSSGIGKCTAKSMLRAGWRVYTISRHPEDMEGTIHLTADLVDDQAVKDAVKSILKAEQTVDCVIHCAGFGISGAVEFTRIEDAKKQLDVNFYGIVRLNHALLPQMRKQGFGRIVMVSSVAGAIPIPFQTYYSVSKAAINAYALALGNEVRPYGITVCAVQPGDIQTGFTAARKKNTEGDEEYGGRISRSVSSMEHDEQTGMKPEVAGRFLARVAGKRSHKPIYTIGFTYKLFCLIVKLLPRRASNYLVGLLYAK